MLFQDPIKNWRLGSQWERRLQTSEKSASLRQAYFFPRVSHRRWDLALAGEESWTDYAFEFEVRVTIGGLSVYQVVDDSAYPLGLSGPGYDAAAYIRFRSETECYRVLFSSRYGVALAKGEQAVIAVASAPFALGVTHRVRLEAVGRRIVVILNGEQIIAYVDEYFPVLSGRVGFGENYAIAKYKMATVIELPTAANACPPRRGRFRMSTWLDRTWLFDGQEPLALWRENACDWHSIKLLPGTAAACSFPFYWMQYGVADTMPDLTKSEWRTLTDERGFCVSFAARNRLDQIHGVYCLRPAYNEAKGSYVYRVEAQLDILKDWIVRSVRGLEFLDLWPVNAIGEPLPHRDGSHRRREYQWGVFREENGRLVRDPLNHNWPMQATPFRMLAPSGCYCLAAHSRVNPLVRFETQAGMPVSYGLCNWAYDMHFRYQLAPLPAFEDPMVEDPSPGTATCCRQGEVYQVAFSLQSIPFAEAQALVDRAVVFPGIPDRQAPVFTFGGDSFGVARNLREPHDEYVWFLDRQSLDGLPVDAVWDRAEGHADNNSIRVARCKAGEAMAVATIGASYFMGAFDAACYEIVVWVKTAGIDGPGPFVLVKVPGLAPERFLVPSAPDGVWQRHVFTSNLLADLSFGYLALGLSGPGTVWFDDLELRPATA